jgi:hypothetical protein
MDSPIFSMELHVAKGRLLSIFIAALLILSANCSAPASHEAKKVAKDPARITDALREETPNDFLRVRFVSAGTSVTTPGQAGFASGISNGDSVFICPRFRFRIFRSTPD